MLFLSNSKLLLPKVNFLVVLQFYLWLSIASGLIQVQVYPGLAPAGTAHQLFKIKFTNTVTCCVIILLLMITKEKFKLNLIVLNTDIWTVNTNNITVKPTGLIVVESDFECRAEDRAFDHYTLSVPYQSPLVELAHWSIVSR